MEQLKVRLVPERNCWVKLPTALLNRLFDSGVQTPLLLVLRPVGPAGASHDNILTNCDLSFTYHQHSISTPLNCAQQRSGAILLSLHPQQPPHEKDQRR